MDSACYLVNHHFIVEDICTHILVYCLLYVTCIIICIMFYYTICLVCVVNQFINILNDTFTSTGILYVQSITVNRYISVVYVRGRCFIVITNLVALNVETVLTCNLIFLLQASFFCKLISSLLATKVYISCMLYLHSISITRFIIYVYFALIVRTFPSTEPVCRSLNLDDLYFHILMSTINVAHFFAGV